MGSLERAHAALTRLPARPGVTAPIIRATAERRGIAAVAALDVALTDEDSDQLEMPFTPRAIRGHD
jgi:aryl-alcohol dehydrogenase-like predicted oxidoreductase